MRSAIRTGSLSKRWRHLPHQLSCLLIGVSDIQSASYVTLGQIMGAYTETTRRLLSSTCECGSRSIKSLRLTFYLSKPFLCPIGHAVGDVARNGDTECLEFVIFTHLARPSNAQLVLFRQRFMSFFHSCPVAFRWLTRLTLHNLAFGDSDVPNLLNACDKLQFLNLRCCKLGPKSILSIDAPSSELQKLELFCFECVRVDLASLPKLKQVLCDTWWAVTTPMSCGFVPQLEKVSLASAALSGQKPFTLSKCLSSSSTRSLSTLCLDFCSQMVSFYCYNSLCVYALFIYYFNVYIHIATRLMHAPYLFFYKCRSGFNRKILNSSHVYSVALEMFISTMSLLSVI